MQATDAALLAADEPAPVRVLRPEARSPFFLTADHAGRLIPARLGRLGLDETERVRHTAWDIGIAGVTGRLREALDATAVLQPYSRLVIDCNRDPTAADSIPEVSEATAIPGNRAVSAAERRSPHGRGQRPPPGVPCAVVRAARWACAATSPMSKSKFART
jgi:predicted N-formylglutamate amidohydrolase